jgi:hypothetical protein
MDRRELLKTLAAVPALSRAHAQQPDRTPLLARVTDLIIPRSDTPGAVDAGVPAIIEGLVLRRPKAKSELDAGLDDLAAKRFLELTEPDQIALLQSIETTPFFKLVKDLTIDAYYSTPEGLAKELGWHGNTYLEEFPGCTHKEHQE